MAYRETIRDNVKILLELKDEFDAILDLYVKSAEIEILSYTNRKGEDVSLNEDLMECIQIKTILLFNKRQNEGLKSKGVAGFTVTYEDENDRYESLLNDLKLPVFFRNIEEEM